MQQHIFRLHSYLLNVQFQRLPEVMVASIPHGPRPLKFLLHFIFLIVVHEILLIEESLCAS